MTGASVPLECSLADAESAFAAANPRSATQASRARDRFPDGTTRAVVYYSPFPLTLARGDGAFVWDVDGHRYLDLVGEFTAGIFGHSPAPIFDAVTQALADGLSLGGPTAYEATLAQLITGRFPACEQIHFCNSGNEATLFALALAQRHTGRRAILAFSGSYHGGSFNFPGGAAAALNAPYEVALARYNDVEGTRRALRANRDSLAAVIVEPLMGSGGCIPAEPAFLQMLRDETRALGIVLIFDEVMCSRLGPGGVQGELGIYPDMTTLGKYLGGGFSFGAFGGSRELMEPLDTRRPNAAGHSGTFNNNVVSMAAGIAGLSKLFTPDACRDLNARGNALRANLTSAIDATGLPMQVTGRGSVMNIHFHDRPIRSAGDVGSSNAPIRRLYHLEMFAAGFYVARRGLLSLSLPVTDADLDTFIQAFRAFIRRHASAIEQHAHGERAALAAAQESSHV